MSSKTDMLGPVIRALVRVPPGEVAIIADVANKLVADEEGDFRNHLNILLRGGHKWFELYLPPGQRADQIPTGCEILEGLKATGMLAHCVSIEDLQEFIDYPALVPTCFMGKKIMAWKSVHHDGDDECVHFLNCALLEPLLQREQVHHLFGKDCPAIIRKKKD